VDNMNDVQNSNLLARFVRLIRYSYVVTPSGIEPSSNDLLN